MDRPEGEFGLIDWIRGKAGGHPRVRIGIGDDCAVLRASPGRETLVTTDMLMDGRHFRLEEAGPEAVGCKALAVNVSDIAAMAGRPTAAFVAVALPRGRARDVAEGLLRGMAPLAERFGIALAGGDTNAWDGPLVVSVTLLGEAIAPGPVLRSGARPGDVILVTGPLGGSLRGRHLRPEPRVVEAQALHRAVALRAMIDLSDGLSSDLSHILEESGGWGAVLDAEAIPCHEDARAMGREDGRSPLDHALHDGEDFELCLTVAFEDAERLLASPPGPARLHRVGVVTREPGIRLWSAGKDVGTVRPRGFDHLVS
jgi:thiamine-monophosphate kinase